MNRLSIRLPVIKVPCNFNFISLFQSKISNIQVHSVKFHFCEWNRLFRRIILYINIYSLLKSSYWLRWQIFIHHSLKSFCKWSCVIISYATYNICFLIFYFKKIASWFDISPFIYKIFPILFQVLFFIKFIILINYNFITHFYLLIYLLFP